MCGRLMLLLCLDVYRLLAKVNRGEARGWDDPRMPTLDGCRRRGIIPEAIERLCEDVGVTRGIQRIPVQRLFQLTHFFFSVVSFSTFFLSFLFDTEC